MKPGYQFRRATPLDLPALGDLLASLFALEPDFPIDGAAQRRGLQLLLDHPERAAVFVVEAAGRAVGMISVQTTLSSAEGAEAALVEDLIVDAAHRGRGLGRGLLDQASAWCSARGIRRMQLLADADNANALAFYDHQGWIPTRLIVRRHRLRPESSPTP